MKTSKPVKTDGSRFTLSKVYIWVLVALVVVSVSIFLVFNQLSLSGVRDNNVTDQEAITDHPATRDELFKRINEERAKKGIEPLVYDEKLNSSSQWKAETMARTHNYAHIDPSTGRNDGLDYLLSLKPQCSYVSENLSWSTSDNDILTTDEAIEWWMNSEDHKKAILDPTYTSTGIGTYGSVAVEHFCRL